MIRPILLVCLTVFVASPPLEAQEQSHTGVSRASLATHLTDAAPSSYLPAPVSHDAVPEPRAKGRHLEVSLHERILRFRDGKTVLFTAPVGVGKSVVLEFEERVWDFSTPRGKRRVLGKEANPVWTPPDWHYVELAVMQRWQLERLERGRPFVLSDGSRVVVRGNRVGRLTADGSFHPVPADEEVVFDGTLFIPPFGTVNRTVEGQLGRYKLDLGEGYLIHGTPDPSTVGSATTHGCLRMLEDDLEFLYRNVPLGTRVIIF
jgi:hypothetical protein